MAPFKGALIEIVFRIESIQNGIGLLPWRAVRRHHAFFVLLQMKTKQVIDSSRLRIRIRNEFSREKFEFIQWRKRKVRVRRVRTMRIRRFHCTNTVCVGLAHLVFAIVSPWLVCAFADVNRCS